LATHPSRAVRIAAVVALRRMQDPGIRVFLNDADEFVVTETARAINDDLSITEALPNLAQSLNNHRFSNEALVRRAINANLRVGKPENMQNLLKYIQFEGAPIPLRNEAIDALSTWAKPSVLDRVDGRYRGEITRPLNVVQQTSAPVLKSLLQHKDTLLRLHAAQGLGKLKINGGIEYLMVSLKKDLSSEVKIEALKSLASLEGAKMDEALKIALADTGKTLRVAGLDLLKSSSLPKELIVTLLVDVINTKSAQEKQAALNTLGTLPFKNTEKALTDLVNQYATGTLTKEIQYELGDAIMASGSNTLKQKYQKVATTSSPDSLKAAYASTMYGGSPGKGKNLFMNNSSAQCVKCHAIDDYGGNVGPRLNGVANRLTTDQLLEALIEPSARIAPGYGNVSLELKNHKKLNGILQAEKPNGYQLKIGNKADTLVRKIDVVNKIMSPSSMPQMHLLLSKKEIRNVIAFLSTLNED
jgi:putative heme-binding domain-containing protein